MPNARQLSHREFVALIALLISLVALSIDAMLPALDDIVMDLHAGEGNERQWIVSSLFLGMAFAQLAYGPASDRFGRKPPIYAGLGLFIAGCMVSIFATSYGWLLAGRFLQGVGAAGPRIVAVAIVRDRYRGDAMARTMSLVMAIFIMVPALAPAVGQAVLQVSHWRAIFVLFLLLSTVALLWFMIRQPETLDPDRRRPLSLIAIAETVWEVCTHRHVIAYTLGAGLVFGAFVGYLMSSQQIFQDQYGIGEWFPLCFGVLALAIGAGSVTNSKLVLRYGMRILTWRALQTMFGLSAGFVLIAWQTAGNPPLWAFMAYLLATFFTIGILFGNFNALAMEPLGHIAGLASAVIGSVTTFLSLLFGVPIGAAYNGSILPLIAGFTLLSLIGLIAVHSAERGHTAG